jgi:hypothetical protein
MKYKKLILTLLLISAISLSGCVKTNTTTANLNGNIGDINSVIFDSFKNNNINSDINLTFDALYDGEYKTKIILKGELRENNKENKTYLNAESTQEQVLEGKKLKTDSHIEIYSMKKNKQYFDFTKYNTAKVKEGTFSKKEVDRLLSVKDIFGSNEKIKDAKIIGEKNNEYTYSFKIPSQNLKKILDLVNITFLFPIDNEDDIGLDAKIIVNKYDNRIKSLNIVGTEALQKYCVDKEKKTIINDFNVTINLNYYKKYFDVPKEFDTKKSYEEKVLENSKKRIAEGERIAAKLPNKSEVYINGNKLTLPMKLDDLKKIGYSIDEEKYKDVTSEKFSGIADIDLKDKDGNIVSKISFFNNQKASAKLLDTWINNIQTTDPKFEYKGIRIGTSESDVIKILGKDFERSKDDSTNSIHYQNHAYDKSKKDNVGKHFKIDQNDKVEEIYLCYQPW